LTKANSAIPRFAPEPFALREIPNGLLNALEAEYKGMHFEEIPEEPVYSQEYDAMEVGGITTKAGHKPSIGHCRISEMLYEQFYQALTPLMEEWCGSPLERAHGYGIRSYGEGSILLLHRDKVESHVISCIVHVDDCSEEEWPLDFIDHEGNHHQVTFKQGQMLFYESLCPHGRLEPFKGTNYRNMYFHWRPTNWDPSQFKHIQSRYKNIEQCLSEWQTRKEITDDWRDWLTHNYARKCNPDYLFKRGLQEGFEAEDISALLNGYRPKPGQDEETQPPESTSLTPPTFLDWHHARLTIPSSRPRSWKVDTDLAQIYEIPDLLNQDECEELISCIDSGLQPSTVTRGPADYRTSFTCHLRPSQSPLVQRLENQLAELLGVDPSFTEPIQGQRYLPGQYFKSHSDWFAPDTDEYRQHTQPGGQRTWTLMIYLNHVESGGRTYFEKIGRSFIPFPGLALAWNNLYANGSPNPFTLHEAIPVTSGKKYIITKWFRAEYGRNDNN
jgi:prolyl 4-hydroxylase